MIFPKPLWRPSVSLFNVVVFQQLPMKQLVFKTWGNRSNFWKRIPRFKPSFILPPPLFLHRKACSSSCAASSHFALSYLSSTVTESVSSHCAVSTDRLMANNQPVDILFLSEKGPVAQWNPASYGGDADEYVKPFYTAGNRIDQDCISYCSLCSFIMLRENPIRSSSDPLTGQGV